MEALLSDLATVVLALGFVALFVLLSTGVVLAVASAYRHVAPRAYRLMHRDYVVGTRFDRY